LNWLQGACRIVSFNQRDVDLCKAPPIEKYPNMKAAIGFDPHQCGTVNWCHFASRETVDIVVEVRHACSRRRQTNRETGYISRAPSQIAGAAVGQGFFDHSRRLEPVALV
jgi:hypothetical protein